MGSNSWYFLSRQTKVLGGLILLSRSLSFSRSLFLSPSLPTYTTSLPLPPFLSLVCFLWPRLSILV